MGKFILSIDNVHCASCEDDILSVLQKQDSKVRVHFHQNKEVLELETRNEQYDLAAALKELHAHGFDVQDVDDGFAVTPTEYSHTRQNSLLGRLKSRIAKNKDDNASSNSENRQLTHEQICDECSNPDSGTNAPTTVASNSNGHSGGGGGGGGGGSSSSNGKKIMGNKAVSKPQNKLASTHEEASQGKEVEEAFRAVYAVEGMTCASCAASIQAAVRAVIPDVIDVSADPLGGAAYVLLLRREDSKKAEAAIEDAGFSATLTEILPLSTTDVKEYSVSAFVRGMTCVSCSNAVKSGLEALPFVSSAKIEVMDGKADIITTEKAPLSIIEETIEDLGYAVEFIDDGTYKEIHSSQANQRARTVTLEVQKIFCERCPGRIMDVLKAYGDAVDIVDPVSLKKPYVKFTYLPSPPRITIRSILRRLEAANPDLAFEIVRPKSLEQIAAENQLKEKNEIFNRLLWAAVIAAPTAVMMFNPKFMMNDKLLFVLATPVYVFLASLFHVKAIKEISAVFRSPKPWTKRLIHFGSMNLLMSMGTSISYWSSVIIMILNIVNSKKGEDTEMMGTYFDSVIFLTFFMLVGRYLDLYSKIKTTSVVSLVSKVRPDTVELWNPAKETNETVPVDHVEVGDLVAVFPGQRCAVDGVVKRGVSDANESMLTGESLPVPKTVDDELYAGTINSGQQTLIVKVTAVGTGTLLDDIVDAVRKGHMQRAPIERYVEQFTGLFVPIVVYLAIIVWIVWSIASHSVLWGMQFAVATFVIACPCGIGLAAPTALYIGSGLAAKYGILARGGGEAFQDGANSQVICFDKTGTITVGGDLRITDTWGAESDEAIQLAMRLESDSVHPLAKAIVEYGQGRKVSAAKCSEISQIDDRGRGMRAEVTGGEFNGQIAVIGNERVIKEVAETPPTKEQQNLLTKWKQEGKSVIILAIKKHGIILMLAAADQVRLESRSVIHRLHELGLQCWMITGDNEETAKAVARKVGIPSDRVISEVLPQQKADKVRDLQRIAGASLPNSQYGRAIVGMVGDGVNDAPALATSDVGIALGRGADIALSSSQFVLLRDDLRALPLLVEISKAVMRKVKMNFFWAAVYNIIAIPLAAGVLYPWTHRQINPVWASLAMALSSVSVMTSSLMLRRYRPKDL